MTTDPASQIRRILGACTPAQRDEIVKLLRIEFDILAVSMEPATSDWSQFRFTVGNWLAPRPAAPELLAVYQPVALTPDEDWTDSLATAIEWWKANRRKTISTE